MSNSFNYTLAKPAIGTLKRNRFVVLSGAGIAQASSPAAVSVGICQFDQDNGDDSPYVCDGVSSLEVDGTTPITENAFLTTDADGKGVVAATGNIRMARALEPADADTTTIRVVFLANQTAEP